ncbi:MAG: ATP-binding protein [Pseudomonadota bacterium]
MLIEFRVKNYRCFRDEQVLSMVPSSDKELWDTNVIQTNFKPIPALLKSAVIYGPNAGGKSTVLDALRCMQAVLMTSTQGPPDGKLPILPFWLNNTHKDLPTEFEISFLHEQVRYQYGFTANREQIFEEFLLVYKNAKPQTWFERTYNESTKDYDYKFSSFFKGQKDSIKQATRPNALFFSTAVQLNNAQLRPLYNWFFGKLFIVLDAQSIKSWSNIGVLSENDERRNTICTFLKSADISIDSIEFIEKNVHDINKELKEQKVFKGVDEKFYAPIFYHTTQQGNAYFGLDQESQGTKVLLYTLSPLLDIIKRHGIICFDELDNSLHTLLVRKIVDLFHLQQDGDSAPQLIFTTHDTALLQDKSLFRRDQVWFVEKDQDQASTLYSLAEFSPRKQEAIAKGYLDGRYGAIPLFNEWHVKENV